MQLLGPFYQYRISVVTGTIAAGLAAGAQLAQFKWTPAAPAAGVTPTSFAVLLKLKSRFQGLTPFTAATLTDHTSLDVFRARPFGAGGGGTTLTLTGNNAKIDTNSPTSLATINVATTGALTAATGLDTQPFAQNLRRGNQTNPTAGTEQIFPPTWDVLEFDPHMSDGEQASILRPGEGVVVANRTVWPAAGTGIYMFEFVWAEGNSLQY